MIDERRETQASLYVLGALPPDEVRDFESVLRSDLELQLLVKELRGTAGAMVAAFPQVAPPPDLKQKILAAVDEREGVAPTVVSIDERAPSWMAWVPWALAACFAILCVALISIGKSLRQHAVELTAQLEEKSQQTADLHQHVAELQSRVSQQTTSYQDRLVAVQTQLLQRIEAINRQTAALTNQLQQQHADTRRQMVVYRDRVAGLEITNQALNEALTTMANTDRFASARIAVLRPTPNGPAGAIGAAMWSAQDQRGMIVLENLPPLPANQSYQLWLIDPKLAIPVSGGVLPANTAGSVRLPIATQFRVDAVDRFAMTIEPLGGMPTPTLNRMVLASSN
jgi:anti-sigma-K factor RskA